MDGSERSSWGLTVGSMSRLATAMAVAIAEKGTASFELVGNGQLLSFRGQEADELHG